MRLIVAGSRTVHSAAYVWEKLDKIVGDNEVECVVSGGARGVDRLGESWAEARGIKVERFEAEWKARGRRAGYLRNVVMAKNATHLIAIWDGESKGTRHMIDIARGHGLQVRIVRADVDGATDNEIGD